MKEDRYAAKAIARDNSLYRLQGSLSFPTITVLPACRAKGSLG
jgi:hypothetical protein